MPIKKMARPEERRRRHHQRRHREIKQCDQDMAEPTDCSRRINDFAARPDDREIVQIVVVEAEQAECADDRTLRRRDVTSSSGLYWWPQTPSNRK